LVKLGEGKIGLTQALPGYRQEEKTEKNAKKPLKENGTEPAGKTDGSGDRLPTILLRGRERASHRMELTLRKATGRFREKVGK